MSTERLTVERFATIREKSNLKLTSKKFRQWADDKERCTCGCPMTMFVEVELGLDVHSYAQDMLSPMYDYFGCDYVIGFTDGFDARYSWEQLLRCEGRFIEGLKDGIACRAVSGL